MDIIEEIHMRGEDCKRNSDGRSMASESSVVNGDHQTSVCTENGAGDRQEPLAGLDRSQSGRVSVKFSEFF